MTGYPPYHPHEALVQPARASANPFRLLGGIVLCAIIYVVLAIFYETSLSQWLGAAAMADFYKAQTPVAVVGMLVQFGFLTVALAIVLRVMHKRPFTSILGPVAALRARCLVCAKFLLPLYLVLFLVPMPEEFRLVSHTGLGTWVAWLPLAIPCVLIQTSAEEVLFRGYLQSQLAARFRHPLVWIGIPSVLFGLLHYSPAMAGGNAWALVLWATLFGVAAADLTARSGTLGPALTLHLVNNIFAILVTAPTGQLDGLALFTYPLDLSDDAMLTFVLPIEIAFTFCAWLTVRLALRV